MSKVRVGGAWRSPAVTSVKIAGSWRQASMMYAKVGGVWKITTFVGEPAKPTFAHTAAGKFTIQNYDSNVVYTTTLVSGGGTASRSGAVITLSDVNARFSVSAGYAANAPQSALGFVERKAYTYHSENQPYACGSHQCNCRSEWANCGCECGGGGCGCYGNSSQSWGQCGCPGTMCWYNQRTVCDTCTSYCDNWVQVKDGTPSGYADAFGEWSKVA